MLTLLVLIGTVFICSVFSMTALVDIGVHPQTEGVFLYSDRGISGC
jgi:hypothetical protein